MKTNRTDPLTTSPLLTAIAKDGFVSAPGLQDGIAVTIANDVGFNFCYASGYWTAASAHGLPDAGLTTMSQVLDRVQLLTKTFNGHVIADADTGFGGLLNVQQTVKEFAQAGVAAIQLEDQTFPKKCGHTATTEVVELEEMATKLLVALEARPSAEVAIIARTDSRRSKGLKEAIARGQKFAELGADLVFVEALHTKEEMALATAEIDAPVVANMATGGKTPILSTKELRDLGFAMAIFPGITSLAAAAAIESVLKSLKTNGNSEPAGTPIYSFEQYCQLVGFPDVWAFEERWKNA